jgi:hypothetical protein
MSENKEYNLKESENAIGQLLPIITDATGKIVDGLHRHEANLNWRTEVREEIKTEEDYWKARAHLNFSRRNAHEARQEKLEIINNLAEYYLKQGLEVSKKYVLNTKPITAGMPYHNEVLEAVIKALKGAIPESWIQQNIDSKYLQKQKAKKPTKPKEIIENIPEPVIEGNNPIKEQIFAPITDEQRQLFIDQITAQLQSLITIDINTLNNFTLEQKEILIPIVQNVISKLRNWIKKLTITKDEIFDINPL